MQNHENTFTPKQWLIFGIVITIGLLLRWLQLDLRPIHHDESLYGLYSYHFFVDPEQKFYRYNPLLHGPFLFNFYPWVFESLGTSHSTLRIPIAFLGSLFMFVPWLFRSFFKPHILIFLTSFVALSPTLVYWSRFLRHDYFVIAALILMLSSLVFLPQRWRFSGFLCAFSLHLCIKENAYVLLAMILGYVFYEYFIQRSDQTILKRASQHLKTFWPQHLIGLSIAGLIFCYFYTSGFSYSEGILDGLYRKTFSYWFEQHKIERIKGPFSFHFFFLSWYEPFFILFVIAQIFLFHLKTTQIYRLASLSSLFLGLIAFFVFRNSLVSDYALWSFFKLKLPIDIFILFATISQAIIITTYHIRKNEQTLAFWGYLFYASFFTYSYLGEKVPWLSLYIFIPGLIYLSLSFNDEASLMGKVFPLQRLLKIVCGLLLFITIVMLIQGDGFKQNLPLYINLLFIGLSLLACYLFRYNPKLNLGYLILTIVSIANFRFALMTNYGLVNEASEFIRQVHTTKEVHELASRVSNYIRLTSSDEYGVLVRNTPIWPLAWYFKNTRDYQFKLYDKDLNSDFTHIFDDVSKVNDHLNLESSYYKRRVPLRSWWVPDYSKMSLKNFLLYSIFHRPWNSPGSYKILFYEKKDL